MPCQNRDGNQVIGRFATELTAKSGDAPPTPMYIALCFQMLIVYAPDGYHCRYLLDYVS